jgi:hypothetical protein
MSWAQALLGEHPGAKRWAQTLLGERPDASGWAARLLGGRTDAAGWAAALLEGWDESKHPRGQPDNAGEFASAPGGGGGKPGKPAGRSGKPRPLTATKSGGRMARFRDAGRRRRVIAAFRSEAELADGVGGRQLPDSEAADVLLLLDARGQAVTDPEGLKRALRQREEAVRQLRRLPEGDPRRADYARVLEAPLLAFECKTLLTQAGPGSIHMSGPAVARKRRFESRYAATWGTVAMDKRRGSKHSGHLLHFSADLHSGKISAMQKVADYGELLALAAGG